MKLLEPFETTQQVKIRQWFLNPVRIQLEKVRTDSVLFYLLYLFIVLLFLYKNNYIYSVFTKIKTTSLESNFTPKVRRENLTFRSDLGQ